MRTKTAIARAAFIGGIFLAAVCLSAGAGAADPTPAAGNAKRYADGVYALNPGYLLSYPRSLWRLGSAPARFNQDDWLAAAAVLGGVGALFALDDGIRDFWQDRIRGGALNNVLDAFEPAGEYLNAAATSFGFYAVAELIDQAGIADSKRGKAAALLTAQSTLIGISITQGLKYLAGRARPRDSKDGLDFSGPSGFSAGKRSFPSGHATVAFSVASTLSHVYGDDYPWVSVASYAGATAVALQRVNDNDHFASDVAVGGLIGYFVGKAVVAVNPFLAEHNMALGPIGIAGAQGAALTYRF